MTIEPIHDVAALVDGVDHSGQMTLNGFQALKAMDIVNVTKGINRNTLCEYSKKLSEEMDLELGPDWDYDEKSAVVRTNCESSFGCSISAPSKVVRRMVENTEKLTGKKVWLKGMFHVQL